MPRRSVAGSVELAGSKGWRRLQRRPALANYYSFAHSSFPLALDLFPRFKEAGRDTLLSGWWIAGEKAGRGTLYASSPFYEIILKPTLAGDIVYPANADEILTAIYDDWRTPDPDFDTVVMAHHLVGFTPMVASYALQRLLIALMEEHRAKATRYAQTLIARGFNADLAGLCSQGWRPPLPQVAIEADWIHRPGLFSSGFGYHFHSEASANILRQPCPDQLALLVARDFLLH